jgi:hypothetical protein
VRGNTLTLPLTQEHLADTIGFSPVHTNKTLKQLRKTGAFKWSGPTFELVDDDRLAGMVGHVAGIGGVRPIIRGRHRRVRAMGMLSELGGWRR